MADAIPIASVTELAGPTAFFTHDATGVPILVTRDEDGGVHAMINSCRHRGTRLVPESRGTATSFVCPFHGWTYDLRGNLAVPGLVRSLPMATRDFGSALVELPCEVRDGLIWVVLPRVRTREVVGD